MIDKMERREFLKTTLAAITSVIGIGVMTPVSAQDTFPNRRIPRRQRIPVVNKPQTNPAEALNGNTSSIFASETSANKAIHTKLYDSVSPLSAEDIERIGQSSKPDMPSFSFQDFYEHDELIQRLKKRGIEIPPPKPEPPRFMFSMPFMR